MTLQKGVAFRSVRSQLFFPLFPNSYLTSAISSLLPLLHADRSRPIRPSSLPSFRRYFWQTRYTDTTFLTGLRLPGTLLRQSGRASCASCAVLLFHQSSAVPTTKRTKPKLQTQEIRIQLDRPLACQRSLHTTGQ